MKTKLFDLNKALQKYPLITDCGRRVSVFRERFPYEDVDEFPYEAIIEGEAYPIDEKGRVAEDNIYSWGGKCLREKANYINIRRLYLKDCDWKPEPKMGDEVLVSVSGKEWRSRIFIKKGNDDSVICVAYGQEEDYHQGRLFDLVYWEYWKWPEEEQVPEYTWEELKEKLGHEFKIKDK